MTGGRLKKAGKLIKENEDFMFTYEMAYQT